MLRSTHLGHQNLGFAFGGAKGVHRGGALGGLATWSNALRHKLHDALLNGVLDVQLVHRHRAQLAHAPAAADGLSLKGGVHDRLHEEDVRSRRQRDANRAGTHCGKEARERLRVSWQKMHA